MKSHYILFVLAALSVSVLVQCQQQSLALPKTEFITAGTHRDVVEGWITDMEAKARVMEGIYSTAGADSAASRIRAINRDIKKKQALIDAPVTKEQYVEVMNLPEFSARIDGVKKRVSKARGHLVYKKYYESDALKSAL